MNTMEVSFNQYMKELKEQFNRLIDGQEVAPMELTDVIPVHDDYPDVTLRGCHILKITNALTQSRGMKEKLPSAGTVLLDVITRDYDWSLYSWDAISQDEGNFSKLQCVMALLREKFPDFNDQRFKEKLRSKRSFSRNN